ncbi:MAG: hypothetical protein J6T13_06505 [Bacteroidales bacterium]|nr:hypothetical protein [Bacteroidales bacterium]
MKQILHLYADNFPLSRLNELVSRTEGVVCNMGVAIPGCGRDNRAATTLKMPTLPSPAPCDPTSLFHYDKMVSQAATFVEQHIPMSDVTLMHAHSIWSGGAVAYELSCRHHIPYIIAADQADMRFWHENPQRGRKTGLPVLEHAERIVFHDTNQQDFIAGRISDQDADRIFSRARTIPDGLDPFWLQNLYLHKPVSLVHTRLLLAGEQLSPKSVSPVKRAVQLLHKKNYNVTLTVAGCSVTDDLGPSVKILPELNQETLFQALRDNDIYIAPRLADSIHPFYAEALSQGMPIIHNSHEAPHGLCPDGEISYATDLDSAEEIAAKVLLASERFATMEQHIADMHPLHLFNWDEIYRGYLRVYDSAGGF